MNKDAEGNVTLCPIGATLNWKGSKRRHTEGHAYLCIYIGGLLFSSKFRSSILSGYIAKFDSSGREHLQTVLRTLRHCKIVVSIAHHSPSSKFRQECQVQKAPYQNSPFILLQLTILSEKYGAPYLKQEGYH